MTERKLFLERGNHDHFEQVSDWIGSCMYAPETAVTGNRYMR